MGNHSTLTTSIILRPQSLPVLSRTKVVDLVAVSSKFTDQITERHTLKNAKTAGYPEALKEVLEENTFTINDFFHEIRPSVAVPSRAARTAESISQITTRMARPKGSSTISAEKTITKEAGNKVDVFPKSTKPTKCQTRGQQWAVVHHPEMIAVQIAVAQEDISPDLGTHHRTNRAETNGKLHQMARARQTSRLQMGSRGNDRSRMPDSGANQHRSSKSGQSIVADKGQRNPTTQNTREPGNSTTNRKRIHPRRGRSEGPTEGGGFSEYSVVVGEYVADITSSRDNISQFTLIPGEHTDFQLQTWAYETSNLNLPVTERLEKSNWEDICSDRI
jgi:hypothetical protein